MSLTSAIRLPAVKAVLDPLLPVYTRNLKLTRVVAPALPGAAHASLVGTAFDYALRFEIERQTRTRSESSWVAEKAVARYEAMFGHDAERTAELLAARRAIAAARECVAAYFERHSVRESDRVELARHSALLAGIDPFYRAGSVALPFRLAPTEQAVTDVAALLACAPVSALLREGPATLNPRFGAASAKVRGADADAIFGDLIVEVKATADCIIDRDMVRQLVGYVLLARTERRTDSEVPEIRRVGILFARFAQLVVLPPIRGTDQQLDNAADELLACADEMRQGRQRAQRVPRSAIQSKGTKR